MDSLTKSSWSYSAFSTAVRCLRQYKLAYLDKLVPNVPESGDMAFGSAMHSAINAELTGGDGQSVFQIYWDSYKDKELDYSRYKWPELAQIGSDLLRKFGKLHAKKYRLSPDQSEVRISGEFKGIRLEGTPDFLGTYTGLKVLGDFKTSGYNYATEKQRIALQLYLYAYLVKSNYDYYPEKLQYLVLNKGARSIQNLSWDFSERTMYEHLDELAEYVRMIEKQEAFPKNTGNCIIGSKKCQYFDVCWEKKI